MKLLKAGGSSLSYCVTPTQSTYSSNEFRHKSYSLDLSKFRGHFSVRDMNRNNSKFPIKQDKKIRIFVPCIIF